jgi:DNA-binding NtrC family response regulator
MSNTLNDNTVIDMELDEERDTLTADRPNGDAAGRHLSVERSSVQISSGLSSSSEEPATLRGILNAAETQVILQALERTGWNRKRAAALLKISYRGLLYKIRSHSITKPMAGD